eukprot:m.66212 g.66212  ORF g.66212 m.66212 type:complete len:1007 (-) comp13724_c0_seq2:55-3075(-)
MSSADSIVGAGDGPRGLQHDDSAIFDVDAGQVHDHSTPHKPGLTHGLPHGLTTYDEFEEAEFDTGASAYLDFPSATVSPDAKMREVVETINALQTIVDKALPPSERDSLFSLPRIVVVGDQSTGKSSILERLAALEGCELLPRDEEMCTRGPIRIELVSDDKAINPVISLRSPKGEENNVAGRAVAKRILEHTKFLTGTSGLNITKETITVTLRSNKVPTLTLVDLPGLIVNEKKKGDQKAIEDLVLEQLSIPNTLVLAVRTAGDDDEKIVMLKKLREAMDGGAVAVENVIHVVNMADKCQTDKAQRKLARQLEKGYQALICAVPHKGQSVLATEEQEEAKFREMAFYSTLQGRGVIGLPALSRRLEFRFISHIKSAIPSMMHTFEEKTAELRKRIPELNVAEVSENMLHKVTAAVLKRMEQLMKSPKPGEGGSLVFEQAVSKFRTKLRALYRDLDRRLDEMDDADFEAALRGGGGLAGPRSMGHDPFIRLMQQQLEDCGLRAIMMEAVETYSTYFNTAIFDAAHTVKISGRGHAFLDPFNVRQRYTTLWHAIQRTLKERLQEVTEETRHFMDDLFHMVAYNIQVEHQDFVGRNHCGFNPQGVQLSPTLTHQFDGTGLCLSINEMAAEPSRGRPLHQLLAEVEVLEPKLHTDQATGALRPGVCLDDVVTEEHQDMLRRALEFIRENAMPGSLREQRICTQVDQVLQSVRILRARLQVLNQHAPEAVQRSSGLFFTKKKRECRVRIDAPRGLLCIDREHNKGRNEELPLSSLEMRARQVDKAYAVRITSTTPRRTFDLTQSSAVRRNELFHRLRRAGVNATGEEPEDPATAVDQPFEATFQVSDLTQQTSLLTEAPGTNMRFRRSLPDEDLAVVETMWLMIRELGIVDAEQPDGVDIAEDRAGTRRTQIQRLKTQLVSYFRLVTRRMWYSVPDALRYKIAGHFEDGTELLAPVFSSVIALAGKDEGRINGMLAVSAEQKRKQNEAKAIKKRIKILESAKLSLERLDE